MKNTIELAPRCNLNLLHTDIDLDADPDTVTIVGYKRGKWLIPLAVAATFIATSINPPSCLAQYLPAYEKQSSGQPQSSAPQLPGATNGTIGPPGQDPFVIEGVAQAPTTKKGENWLPIGINMVAFIAIFLLIRRKKADIWAMGAGVATIMVVLGLTLGLFGIK